MLFKLKKDHESLRTRDPFINETISQLSLTYCPWSYAVQPADPAVPNYILTLHELYTNYIRTLHELYTNYIRTLHELYPNISGIYLRTYLFQNSIL